MNRSRFLFLSIACILSLTFVSAAWAQNSVADWDANTLNAVVTSAKKAPAVAPVHFAYVTVAVALF